MGEFDLIERLRLVSIQFLPFMVAVVFHEYAHGLIALKWGDQTAQKQGRLTLNPLPHLHPIGTVLFPLIMMFTGLRFLIGWAKPVPINPARFKNYRKGLFWVSLAGPLMNFLLATASVFIFCIVAAWVPEDSYFFEPLLLMTRFSVIINFALGFFNLLPLPPLDGSKVIQAFMSYKAAMRYESLSRFSFLILIGLMATGGLSFLTYPILFFTNATFYWVGRLLGLDLDLLFRLIVEI